MASRTCCSVTQLCPTFCDPMDCSTLDLPVLLHLLEFAQIHIYCISIPSSYLILWHPSFLLPSVFASIRDFFSESSVYLRWPKYWSFNFSISPSSEYSELMFFKIAWFDHVAVKETFRSLPQHQNSKASVLWCSVFSTVFLS